MLVGSPSGVWDLSNDLKVTYWYTSTLPYLVMKFTVDYCDCHCSEAIAAYILSRSPLHFSEMHESHQKSWILVQYTSTLPYLVMKFTVVYCDCHCSKAIEAYILSRNTTSSFRNAWIPSKILDSDQVSLLGFFRCCQPFQPFFHQGCGSADSYIKI